MRLSLLSGTAHVGLAEAVATSLGTGLAERELTRFPDGEFHVQIHATLRGADVYVIQPTGPPVEQHLFELFLLADASRRAGAARLTAVVPYFGYARQDRRARGREAVGARVVADLLYVCGFDRVVSLDVHTPAIEGFLSMPLEHLSAVPLVAEALRPLVSEPAVVVAPDLGAANLAERYATLLGVPIAIVHKTRISGEAVTVSGVTGDVRGRAPIIVDDMISTGATVEAAFNAVAEAGCRPEPVVAATHGLFVGRALERLQALPVRRLIVTNSLPTPGATEGALHVVGIEGLLAEAIRRLQANETLADLIAHG